VRGVEVRLFARGEGGGPQHGLFELGEARVGGDALGGGEEARRGGVGGGAPVVEEELRLEVELQLLGVAL
jgi:hypothetical protein